MNGPDISVQIDRRATGEWSINASAHGVGYKHLMNLNDNPAALDEAIQWLGGLVPFLMGTVEADYQQGAWETSNDQ